VIAYSPNGALPNQYLANGTQLASNVVGAGGLVSLQNSTPVANTNLAAGGFAEKGEAAFKAADYNGAVYAWRHAVVDEPQNPVLVMMLGQGLFATGKFDEAAGAVQSAMQTMPKDKWGVVVTNYRDLYGSAQDYTNQLRALEKAVKDKPEDPAQRFLLGFHYAYLGYPQNAVDQLERGLKVAPQDEMAKQLRDEMRAKLPKPVDAPVVPGSSSNQSGMKFDTLAAAQSFGSQILTVSR
jgi:tetratricopeptide (TPR) repeat protein